LLQRHFHDDWAANCMLQLMVDDLDAWWSHIDSLDLPRHFGVPTPKPPRASAHFGGFGLARQDDLG
jgi:hypothetical protein